MDWKKIISEIIWIEEITEKELSRTLITPVTQSALNRLKQGQTRMPHYDLGNELIKRHKKLIRQQHNQQSLG